MIDNRINYFEYLGLRPEATIEEIKRAIQENEAMFLRDGIDKQSISKTMANEELRNIEREKYLEILRKKQINEEIKLNKIEYDYSIDSLDIDDVKKIECWNCGTGYETGLFYNEYCPICSAEASARKFNEEIFRIDRQINDHATKEQLIFSVDLLIKKYASKPNYRASEVLNSILEQINNLQTLDSIHAHINVALENLEKNYNKKRIFTAYKEYEKYKEIFVSEGINYDPRVMNVINKYKDCEQCLNLFKDAAQKKDYNVLFANIKTLKLYTDDCYELDEIMKENPIPAVTNLYVIECNNKIHFSWDYDITGISFSIHKILNGEEFNVVEEIYEKEFEYEEQLNGVEISYKVCAHFENLNSHDNPVVKVKFFDNVKNIVEQKVSGTVTYNWVAPEACEIVVIKKENDVPSNWEDGTFVKEVNQKGFTDRDVVRGKTYGYKIKCIYNFDGSKYESREINIHPALPYFDFLPISIIDQEILYEKNIWKVKYYPLKIGNPILLVNNNKLIIDENKKYSLTEINEMGFEIYKFDIKGDVLIAPIETGYTYNFYIGAIYEEQIYLKTPIEVINNGFIQNIKVNNIGGLNKTLEILFTWGKKSKQIILVDNENDYLDDHRNVIDSVYKFKDVGKTDDAIIMNLKDRINHFITIFEVDELGNSRLIKQLEPLTKNKVDLFYEFKFKKNKIITTLYLNYNCKINDIYLCKAFSNGKIEKLYGPVGMVTKYSLFKGLNASFVYESENLNFDSNYVLKFNGNSNSKVFNINGKTCMLVLKEKNNE